jgi:hypothetical protein
MPKITQVTTIKTTCSKCNRKVSAGGDVQPPQGEVLCLWCAIGYSGEGKLGIDIETKMMYDEHAYNISLREVICKRLTKKSCFPEQRGDVL